MPPDLHNDATWPQYPFAAVTGPEKEATAVSLGRGELVRHVVYLPLAEVQALYQQGQTPHDIVTSVAIRGTDLMNTDIAIDWKPV
jgi:hypothetical protein